MKIQEKNSAKSKNIRKSKLYNKRNNDLEYLFQRLHVYVLREAPFIQQIFQVLKNHFLDNFYINYNYDYNFIKNYKHNFHFNNYF
jgi:hypothetical protein